MVLVDTDVGVEAERTATAIPSDRRGPVMHGAVTGTLVGFADDGQIPLVTYDGQPGSAAITARASVDLHGSHVGRSVVLLFERGDPHLPLVVGWVRQDSLAPPLAAAGRVEVDADGERMIVSAKEQLVLRCGAASITLTKAGKVIIRGAYVVSHSSGANRVHGATVHLN
jgi:Domain of unknown function (DUF6484)